MLQQFLVGLTAFGCVALAGCGGDDSKPSTDGSYSYNSSYYDVDYKSIEFSDNLTSNAAEEVQLRDLTFLNPSGDQVTLSDYVGKGNLVVVVTRGYPGEICIFCSTQVSRLIANYDEIAEQNAQVVAIFPVKSQADSAKLEDLLTSVREKLADPTTNIPFPILLDVELNVVKQLQIERDLSAPATYIVDAAGHVKFAYVGESNADRPSSKEIVRQLQEINEEEGVE